MMEIAKHKQLQIARLGIYYFFGFSSLLIIFEWIRLPNILLPHTFGIINYLILIFFYVQFFRRNLLIPTFVAYSIFLLFLVSMLHLGNYPYIINILGDSKFLFGSIAALFIFSLCDDSEKILTWSAQIGYFVIIVHTTFYIWQVSSHIEDGMNYMNFANSTVTAWAMVAYDSVKKKKWYGILFTIISGFFIAMYGSRGGILCMLAFVIFYAIFSTESKVKKLIITGVLFLAGVSFFAFFNKIILLLTKISELLGADSRTIYFMKNLKELNFFSRTEIWDKILPIIDSNPFIGSGIGADNYYLGGYAYTIHNGYLELILNFGYIIGGMLLISIFVIGIYMLFFCKDKEWRMLFGIFYMISIPKLMFSYSIYLNYELYASIAIYFCYLRSRKLKNIAYN